MDVVREVARGLARRLRYATVEIEDLEADGFEALVKALDDYDSSKGSLNAYIVLRCRGAMIDGLRRKMLVGRRARERGASEPAVLSLEDEVSDGLRLIDVLPDPTAPPADVTIANAPRTELPTQVAALPKRYQRILLARFLYRRSRREIASAEGVSTDRVAKIEMYIRGRVARAARPDDADELTQKELTVLKLAADGASAAETAKRLHKALETVKTQRRTIIAKLRARNITNAVAISYQQGLLAGRELSPRPPQRPHRQGIYGPVRQGRVRRKPGSR
jgi:RNA polymerase sigma factor (sigma-70 family)